jgi:hypothetical protein
MIMTILKMFMVAAYAGLGYGYYYFVGCDTGTCPITSNPVASTAYAAALGAIITFGLVPLIRKKSDEE